MMQTAFDTPSELPKTQAQGRASNSVLQSFGLNLEDHQICHVIGVGTKVDAITMDLPGGILILGALRGRVNCAKGSAIIGLGGEFQGTMSADDVVVEGRITSPMDANQKPVPSTLSQITARGTKAVDGSLYGGLVVLSTTAVVCARLRAVAWQIPHLADLGKSTLETIMPIEVPA